MPATEPRFGRAPGAWPLLGHMVALQRHPLALLGSLPAHGDLVEARLDPRPAYVVCHPGLARQVLTDLRTSTERAWSTSGVRERPASPRQRRSWISIVKTPTRTRSWLMRGSRTLTSPTMRSRLPAARRHVASV
jgi:hypothetical protein